ncbi:MAG: DnaD domain protein [Anaerovoracaceae bacterium]|jgi:DnaD/phage-associated family protein
MKFKSEDIGTGYLFDTPVENIFINEYMPMAPEGYVKVFLLARMYMNSGNEAGVDDIAKTLAMSEDEVEKALIYWAKNGLIERNPQGIEFVSLKERLYGSRRKKQRVSSRGRQLLDNKNLRQLMEGLREITGQLPSGSDINEVAYWVDDIKATNEVILGAARYCAGRGKRNVRYIGSVVKDWTSRGMATAEDVEKHLADADEKHYVFRRVMKALGFNRNATEEEKRIITSWVDDMGCSMDEILDACSKTSGISNPNINYINAVLCGRHGVDKESGRISNAVVQQYYAAIRGEAEAAARERKEEVRSRYPSIAGVEDQMVDCSSELTRIMVAGGADKLQRMDEVRRRLAALEKKKTVLLTENGVPVDYEDVRYKCSKCGDTGTTESGSRCECWLRRSEEAARWYNSKSR